MGNSSMVDKANILGDLDKSIGKISMPADNRDFQLGVKKMQRYEIGYILVFVYVMQEHMNRI